MLTLEVVFVRKLQSDPLHVLDVARDFLEQGPGHGTYARKVIDEHLLPWLELNDDNEELARRELGFELMNLLRPV